MSKWGRILACALILGGLIGLNQSQADPLLERYPYVVEGTSTGVGWAWKLVDSQHEVSGTVADGTVPNGGTATAIVQAFVVSINAAQTGQQYFEAASATVNGYSLLYVKDNSNLPFTLYVGAITPNLEVGTTPVSFNPTIYKWTGQGPAVPTFTEWGLIILALLAVGWVIWTVTRRRAMATA
jgi:hypothetical protein